MNARVNLKTLTIGSLVWIPNAFCIYQPNESAYYGIRGDGTLHKKYLGLFLGLMIIPNTEAQYAVIFLPEVSKVSIVHGNDVKELVFVE